MAAFTVDQADARLEELSRLLREIRARMTPEYEARFVQVREAGENMLVFSDAWFAENPDYPRDVPINAIWVSDLEHVTQMIRNLHAQVVGPSAPSPLFWVIGGIVLLSAGFVFYRSAFSKLDGFQDRWEEFRQHLHSSREKAARGDCNDAYAHWEQARLLTDSLDDRPRANKTLIAAAREVRRNC